jgi:glutathione-independent formaldehyde dehydrogenase
VEFIKVGDLCSVPFNISSGRCRNSKEGHTGVCLNVNPDRPGSAYGYVDMGGRVDGQAEYVMVPYADWNLLNFPDKDQALEKILDPTMLSDIFPTGFLRHRRSGARIHRLHCWGGTGGAGRRDLGAASGEHQARIASDVITRRRMCSYARLIGPRRRVGAAMR